MLCIVSIAGYFVSAKFLNQEIGLLRKIPKSQIGFIQLQNLTPMKYYAHGTDGMMRSNSKRFFFCFLVFLSFFKLHAQDEVDYSVHANIIYHFTKYINWPSYRNTGDFVIGVVGDTPLIDELKKVVTGKKAAEQNIVVKKFSTSSSTFNCQILFISDDASYSLKKIVSATINDPVLLVSENKGFAGKGSCINFNIVNDKLKLEINKNNILQRGLEIASELLQLGTQVK